MNDHPRLSESEKPNQRQMEDVDLFYDRMVQEKDWDETANNFETQRRLEIVFRLLADFDLNGKTFLDGGSGGGHFSAKACSLGADVTSVDVGESLLDQVRAKCDSTTIIGDLMQLPFEDGSFDFVMSTEVIEHTPDPKVALKELARVVKPGGRILVTTPCKTWQPVVRAASTLKLRPFQGRENFSWPRVGRRILEDCGVDVTKCFGFNLLPVFKPILKPFFKVTDKIGGVFPELFVNFALMGEKRID